ncbi:MAG: putative ABC transporter permease [Clostridiales bacterium]|nr:putative ABC transporter permease [Clostridiales bacterium]
MDYTLYELGWLFLIYSLAGWCLSVALEAAQRRTFVNTGVLNLPVSPVYGFSAVAISVFLTELKSEFVFLFIGGMLLTAFVAFDAGIVLEHIFHRKWTDYHGKRFSVGGLISVPLLLIGGGGAIFVLWFGNPLILRVVSWIPDTLGHILLLILLIVLALDLFGTLAIVWKWKRYIDRVFALTDNMQTISTNFGNAITRAVCHRLERSYPNIETKKLIADRNARKETVSSKFAEGCCFYKLALIFILASLIGDLAETVFCRFSLGYWMSRSSLVYGPFSVIWGMACVMLTAFLYGHRDKSDRYIFVYGMVAGGTYEYVCSVLAELVFGASFWNYSHIPFNLGGRINLLFCFFWGCAAVIWLKMIYPRLSDLIEKIPMCAGKIITWILVVLMTIDMGISAMALIRYSDRQNGVEASSQIERILDEHFTDARMEKIYPKAKIVSR